jgi:hypothetical protein
VGSDDVTKRRSMMVVVTRPVLVGMGTGSMGSTCSEAVARMPSVCVHVWESSTVCAVPILPVPMPTNTSRACRDKDGAWVEDGAEMRWKNEKGCECGQ